MSAPHSPRPWLLRLGCLLFALGHLARAAEPMPDVLACAAAEGIPLTGIDAPADAADAQARAGDTLTVLITLEEPGRTRQWLASLCVAELTEEERARPAPAPLVMHSSTGAMHLFRGAPVALELVTHGPFEQRTDGRNRAPGAARRARTLVNAEHLALGLDRPCRAALRLAEVNRGRPESERGGIGLSTQPFPAEQVAAARATAEAAGVTVDDERAFAGLMPALAGFFSVAESTPGLREIMFEIVEKPSAWSLLKRGGRVEPFFSLNLEHVTVPPPRADGREVYQLPVGLALNDRPALACTFEVTAPLPPLLTSAGIVTLTATPPVAEGETPPKRLVVQVAAARRAPADS